MTTTSPMLICPMVKLAALPDAERDVLRRGLTEHVQGIDTDSNRRWRRFVYQLSKAEPGETFELVRAEPRSLPFHKRHRAILDRLFAAQERYRLLDGLHDYLKVKTHFVTWGENRHGNPICVPRSTAWDVASEDEIREFHGRMVDYLHDPECQKHLWRHLPAARRAEMVETVLAKPEEQQR